jgi:molybdate transport repressor ModE-like protein/molybdopterin-binding protein
MSRASAVTSTDIALLRSIGRERSVVAASRRVGISRDRAVYRLERLARAFGGPITTGSRGGRGHGGTTLTPLGDRVARGGFDSLELLDARPIAALSRPNLLRGTYRAGASPEVVVGGSLRLTVAFSAQDGQRVTVALDPEAIVVARGRFPSSARNVIPARVASVHRVRGSLGITLVARTGRARLRVALTEEPVRRLGLRTGVGVVLYVKATALRHVGPRPGGPRAAVPRR